MSTRRDMRLILAVGGVGVAGAAGYALLKRARQRRKATTGAEVARAPTAMELAGVVWDVWRAGSARPAELEARQRRRLADLIAFARAHSPYYRTLYRDVPVGTADLRALPVVSKPELMADFDEWVTDQAVTKAGVDAFVADPTLIGERFLGRYAVWTTSGTTGRPGIFVNDARARAIYNICGSLRATTVMRMLDRRMLRAFLRRGSRNALLAVGGGHFAAASETEWLRRHLPWIANSGRLFSALEPLPALVRQLNDFQPNRIGGYPTALALLAEEQRAGRLRIRPSMVTPSGESLTPMARERLHTAFRCPVRTVYSASEFLGLAFECPHGWLHVNSDWAILEPVDEAYRPAPAGQRSHTVLLTNLANRTQPLIRYDLGDSITVKPEPCACGSPLQAIRVEGRKADVLRLRTPAGKAVPILPLAIGTVVEEAPGVRRCQVIQTGPAALAVRLEMAEGADAPRVRERVERRLQDFLAAQGAPSVGIEFAAEPPRQDPVSGKFRQVWAAPSAVAPVGPSTDGR